MRDFDHCLEVLRTQDRDRYLACLLLRKEIRAQVVGLYAFNSEISRVRDRVSEPLPGEIRLQWWRDAIALTSGEARANPVASVVLDAIEAHDLPREAFDKILLARAFDLYDDPMPTIADLEGYTGETTSVLFQLAALISGQKPSDRLSECCAHAGVAYGMMLLLCDIARHASRGQLYLPMDVLVEANAEPARILSGEMHDGLEKALSILIAHCRTHKLKADRALVDLPKAVHALFLPLCLIEPYLRKMQKPGFNPFKDRVEISQIRAQWALWRGQ